jgi:protein-tyrosine phosphatase
VIDTHCHILPMCDDGPDHWMQSLEMARDAVRQGITTVVATPHHKKHLYFNGSDKIKMMVEKMNAILASEDIPLKVWSGQEYHLNAVHSKRLAMEFPLVLSNSKYVLVELPSRDTPKLLPAFIRFLKENDIVPIIAHPERHLPFIREPLRMYELIESGVRFQLTAPSLVGHYGTEVQQAAWTMARNRWVHLLASDAHDINKRGFRLREAYWLLEAGLGKEAASFLKSNAELLVQGATIEQGAPIVPQESKRKRLISIWR